MAVVITGVTGDIYRSLQTLFSTPVGMLVNDREYGFDWGGVDYPPDIAETMLLADAMEKVERYEPRAQIEDITRTMDVYGNMGMEVIVSYADQEQTT